MKTILKTSTPIIDGDVLAELNKSLPEHLQKAMADTERPRNGFWAYASVEDPAGDMDGDIIDVAGIECDLSPSDQRYLPLLGSHLRKLPDGGLPQLGRIEMTQKTKYKDMSAYAMYFTFALKEDGTPINARVAEHYEAYKAGYCNAFSVGMEATSEPVKIKDKGFRYPKTKLFEVSMVGIGANAHALGVTRGAEGQAEQDEVAAKLLETIAENFEKMDKWTKDMRKFIEDRFDDLEGTIAVQKVAKPAPVAKAPDQFAAALAEMNRRIKVK